MTVEVRPGKGPLEDFVVVWKDGVRVGTIQHDVLVQAAEMNDRAIHESWVHFKRKYPQP